jgi:hypothetical protein
MHACRQADRQAQGHALDPIPLLPARPREQEARRGDAPPAIGQDSASFAPTRAVRGRGQGRWIGARGPRKVGGDLAHECVGRVHEGHPVPRLPQRLDDGLPERLRQRHLAPAVAGGQSGAEIPSVCVRLWRLSSDISNRSEHSYEMCTVTHAPLHPPGSGQVLKDAEQDGVGDCVDVCCRPPAVGGIGWRWLQGQGPERCLLR